MKDYVHDLNADNQAQGLLSSTSTTSGEGALHNEERLNLVEVAKTKTTRDTHEEYEINAHNSVSNII